MPKNQGRQEQSAATSSQGPTEGREPRPLRPPEDAPPEGPQPQVATGTPKKERHTTPTPTDRPKKKERGNQKEKYSPILFVLLGPFSPFGLFSVVLFLVSAFTLLKGKALRKDF